mmetsp:Transcript_3914/g.7546  ORF Transcript_3914/g.7546 Transcript_3914/m.7546 type:complete len:93 (+) Transcript_3914:86-364(+)
MSTTQGPILPKLLTSVGLLHNFLPTMLQANSLESATSYPDSKLKERLSHCRFQEEGYGGFGPIRGQPFPLMFRSLNSSSTSPAGAGSDENPA